MCIIVDASVASLVFKASPSPGFKPIMDWLRGGDGRLAYGGKLAKELQRVGDSRRLLYEFQSAGKAKLFTDSELEIEQQKLEKIGGYKSNDLHVLALARASRVRLLCAHDTDLENDFKNKRFVDPRGKVYDPIGRTYKQKAVSALLRHRGRGSCPLVKK